MNKIKKIYENYRHGIPLLVYMGIYFAWFSWLERRPIKNFRIIHIPMDDYIPFCEAFIIPYLLWFIYIAVVVLFLFFKNKNDYYKSCVFLFTGMTIFLIVSTFWPNVHHLRPRIFPRNNCFTYLISILWKTDTPTNLWPSIHVYNSLGAHFAVMHNNEIANYKFGRLIRFLSGSLAISIILSTVFIKQHSVFDVIMGIVMGLTLYLLVYRKDILLSYKTSNKNKRTPQAG